MAQNILLEVSPILPDGSLTTLRMSAAGTSSKGVYLDNHEWLPIITDRPVFDIKLTNNGLLDEISISYGSIGFNVSEVFGNEVWSTYDWTGALGRIWVGQEGDPFAEYTQIFEGSVSALARDSFTASVTLLGTEADLNVDLLFDEYEGTGGAEGPATLRGKLKPWASGFCSNVEPVLVDSAYWIYQVHGYGAINDIPAVYEFAQKLNAPIASVSTFAQLAALTLSPGQWAKCLPLGMFRLGGQPSQKLTADVEGAKRGDAFPTSISDIIEHLISVATPAATFGSFSIFEYIDWCFYATAQAQLGSVARQAALEAGGYLFPDATGTWQIGNFFSPKAPIKLSSKRDAEPLVVSVEEITSGGPIYKVRVGHDRCWSTHSDAEISPAILEIAQNADAIAQDAEAALEAAQLAVADTEVATTRLNAMSSDGMLDRAEKKYWIGEHARLSAERTELIAEATAFPSVSGEVHALQVAWTNLNSYLASLSPSWNTLTQDTAVTRSSFVAAWHTVYVTRQSLQSAMTAQAGQTAGWSNVSDRPTSLDGLDPTAGTKLDGIEDGATVGAPSGTEIGGRDVDEFFVDFDANAARLNQARDDIDDLINTYGNTASSVAARDAAIAARDAANLAAANAETSEDNAASSVASVVAASKKMSSTVASQFPKLLDPSLFHRAPSVAPPHQIVSLDDANDGSATWVDPNRASLTLLGPISNSNLYHNGLIEWVAGRRYRIHADIEIISSSAPVRTAAQARLIDEDFTTSTSYGWWARPNAGVTLEAGQRGTFTDELTVSTVAAGIKWGRIGLITNRAPSGVATVIADALTRIHALWVEDITSEFEAESSASAASTSASTASTKADEAGVSATASQASATAALVSQNAASTSAGTATSQASAASGHAANAATHATTSANWASAVSATSGITLNGNFKDGMTGWFSNTEGNVASATHWQASYENAGGVFVRDTANRYNLFSSKMSVNPARKYRMRCRIFANSASIGRVYLGLVCYNANGEFAGFNQGRSYATGYSSALLAAGWNEIDAIFTGVATNPSVQMLDVFAPNTTAVQLMAYMNFSNTAGVVQAIDTFYLEDVTESVTAAEQATISAAQAVIATNQASSATSSAASAATSALVAAGVSAGAINNNTGFDNYASGTAGQLPADWITWANTTTATRVADGQGGYSIRLLGPAGLDCGIIQENFADKNIQTDSWYVMDFEWSLNAGTNAGAAMNTRFYNSSSTMVQQFTLNCATDISSTGAAIGAGVIGSRYRITKLIRSTAANAHGYRVYAAAHFSSAGSIIAANDITVHRALLRVATNAEIAAGTTLPDLEATVSSQSAAIATATTRTAAYLTKVTSGVGTAELALVATDSNGAAASEISLKADKIKLGSLTSPVLEIVGGQAIFGGKLKAGTVDAAAISVANLSAISSNLGSIQVGMANIADLSVSTIKLQNQAVTIPVGAYTEAPIQVTNVSSSANAGTVIQSATIASTGAPLKIDFSFAISGDAHVNHRCHIRVRRGTTQILLITDITAGLIEGRRSAISFNFTDTPSAGTHTYYLEVSTSIGGSARNRGLYLLETKK